MVSRVEPEKRKEHSLEELQSFMWQAVSRPLTNNFDMQKRWSDGSSLSKLCEQFVKSNSSLTSFRRLEIYNQQYWYRLLDCFEDDFPGLKAILGEKKFYEIARQYLREHPSRSFSLRDLGSALADFLVEHRELVDPHFELSYEMVRFEWAQVVAFDGPSAVPVCHDYIQTVSPENLRVRLQPYLTLLELHYALDEYSNALKRHQRERGEAASDKRKSTNSKKGKPPSPVPEKVYLAIHRHENSVFFKRLEPPAFVILTALSEGKSLTEALLEALTFLENHDGATDGLEDSMRQWFGLWIRLGWLCVPDGDI